LDSPDNAIVGGAIFPYFHYLNHSCDANAAQVSDGGRSELVTTEKPIKAGEEIFVSYRCSSDPYPRRQVVLKRRYGFECKCTKCQLGNTSPESIIPSFKGKFSEVYIKDILEQFEDIKLSSLDEQYRMSIPNGITSDEQDGWLALSQIYASTFKAFDDAYNKQTAEQRLNLVESAMKSLHKTGIWPHHLEPYPQLRSLVIDCFIVASRFNDALRHSMYRYFKVDPVIYPDPRNPARINNIRMLIKLLKYEGSGMDSSKFPFDIATVCYNLTLDVMRNLGAYFKPDHAVHKEELKNFEELKRELSNGDARVLVFLEKNKEMEWLGFESYAVVPY
jgi:hypothetical protein